MQITSIERATLAAVLVFLVHLPSLRAQKGLQHKKQKVDLVCPPYSARQPTFLTLPCLRPTDCLFGDLCCPLKPGSHKSRCFPGVPKPLPEQKHEPLFGFLPTACPNPPVAELLPVTKCSNDTECWPRVCCPDGQQRFCRTPQPHWDQIPRHQHQPVFQMLRNAMKFLQCSPQPLIDLFPRTCQLPQDCFPDLCCQEADRKVCRRPRRSLLSIFYFIQPTTTTQSSLKPPVINSVSSNRSIISNETSPAAFKNVTNTTKKQSKANQTSFLGFRWPMSLETLEPL